MDSQTTCGGWQHLPEVLRTRVFSPSSWHVFVFRLAVKPPHLLLITREYRDKENWNKIEPETRMIQHGLDVQRPNHQRFHASTFNDFMCWTCARLQSIGKCGLLRRLSLFRPTFMRVKTGLANPVKWSEWGDSNTRGFRTSSQN